MIVAFDVLCLLLLPLLIFSVFKFYTKGNLIIVAINVLFQGLRWISGVVFEASDKTLKESWRNLYEVAQYGASPECQI
jgi:integral membrane sensor domain MASE1